MMNSPSVSDVVNAIITARYLRSCQVQREKFCSNHFRVLCYLGEATRISGRPQFTSFVGLSARFDAVVGVKMGLAKTFADLSVINGMDSFSREVESIRMVLISDPNASFNGLSGPSFASGDSSIGLFLRFITAWWECLQFDESCKVFSQFVEFLRNGQGAVLEFDAHPDLPRNPFRFCNRSSQCGGVSNADLIAGDVRAVEDRIHRQQDLFSESMSAPLSSTDTKSSHMTIPTALSRLLQNDAIVEFSAKEPQHAMLNLATMWQRTNNPTMALSAIEEALKTAHQLGDHTTVAHALLLLYEVISSAKEPELFSSVEDILLRCSQRCAALGLQHLTAKCTLLLAHMHSQQLPATSRSNLMEIPLEHGELDNPVSRIWNTIAFALLGEISLSSQVVTKQGITDDTEFTQSGSSANPLLSHLNQHQSNAAKKENIREVPMNMTMELANLTCEAHILSASIWTRLHMLPMAELSLRRALRNFDLHVQEPSALTEICSALLIVQADLSSLGNRHSKHTQTDVMPVLYNILKFGKCARAVITQLMPDAFTQQRLECSLIYVLYRLAVQDGNNDKALRLANRLASLSAPHTASLSIDEVPLTPLSVGGYCKEEYFRAMDILIEATARVDDNAARCLQAKHGQKYNFNK